MNITLTGTKVKLSDRYLGFQWDNNVEQIIVTVDTDEEWQYKLDTWSALSGEFNSILLYRNGNQCSVTLTRDILSCNGRYTMQLRGYTDTKTMHSDKFDVWVKDSLEYQCCCCG